MSQLTSILLFYIFWLKTFRPLEKPRYAICHENCPCLAAPNSPHIKPWAMKSIFKSPIPPCWRTTNPSRSGWSEGFMFISEDLAPNPFIQKVIISASILKSDVPLVP